MTILVTGGAGYVGNAFCHMLSDDFIVLDSLERSLFDSIRNFKFVIGDISNANLVSKTIKENDIKTVVHFAGYKSVQESISSPNLYLETNLVKSKEFIDTAISCGVDNFIFSSSCSVYGESTFPVDEDSELNPISPYAQYKLQVEEYIRTFSNLNSVSLRYFNVSGISSLNNLSDYNKYYFHLIPSIIYSALNKEVFYIRGNNYNTGIRDYIYIEDVAQAHLSSLDYLRNNPGHHVFNIGTGVGYSVLRILHKVQKLTNLKINYEYVGSSFGDPSYAVANFTKAKQLLNWTPTHNIDYILSSYLKGVL